MDESKSPEHINEEADPDNAEVEKDEEEATDLEEDLFGGEEDNSDQEQPEAEVEPDQSRRQQLEYEEDNDAQAATENFLLAEVALPNLPLPKPYNGQHWDFRLPNFLNLNCSAFKDEEFLYEQEGSDKEGETEDTRNNLSDHNVIRWRWKKNELGEMVRQSNARAIRWDDGSQSLQVGSELFDMVSIIDGRQQASLSTQSEPVQGLSYLFAQHSELQLLESQASITGQVSLRPYTLNSLTHRTLVASRGLDKARAQRHTQGKIVVKDPEQHKLEQDLEDARQLKELKRLESKLARQNSRQSNLVEGGSSKFKSNRRDRFNSRLIDDDGVIEDDLVGDDQEEYEEDQYEELEDDQLEESKRSNRQEVEEMTELEIADQKLEQAQKKKRIERDQPPLPPPPPPPPVAAVAQNPIESEPKMTKRKLIIASDDEDE